MRNLNEEIDRMKTLMGLDDEASCLPEEEWVDEYGITYKIHAPGHNHEHIPHVAATGHPHGYEIWIKYPDEVNFIKMGDNAYNRCDKAVDAILTILELGEYPEKTSIPDEDIADIDAEDI